MTDKYGQPYPLQKLEQYCSRKTTREDKIILGEYIQVLSEAVSVTKDIIKELSMVDMTLAEGNYQ